jgi:hypothetical protein
VKLFGLAVALLRALVVAAPAAAKDRYCSPTGDYCTSAAKLKGVRYLRVGTFSFTGRVRICVKDPTAANVCHAFRLTKARPLYQVKLIWKRHYPVRGAGTYRVTFCENEESRCSGEDEVADLVLDGLDFLTGWHGPNLGIATRRHP